MRRGKTVAVFLGFVVWISLLSSSASANVKEMKAYKEAFPGTQAKCAVCHIAPLPKKDAVGLNDYGQAFQKAERAPAIASVQKLGKAENFKKK